MSSAILSDCGKYRYVLKRDVPCVLRWIHPVLFIMLNPSTADASVDDPTIRRCRSFAERWQCTELTVVNLFAYRSTKPAGLKIPDNPIGPENDRHIEEQVYKHRNSIIVAAWGKEPFAQFRAEEVTRKYGPFQCLLRNKNGSPGHPLFIPGDTPLQAYP